jgi:hypothetical protein
MRPRDAVAPAPEVGVVASAIADRPHQQAHAAVNPSLSSSSRRSVRQYRCRACRNASNGKPADINRVGCRGNGRPAPV